MSDLQTIFDRVARHLLTQGEPCADGNADRRYAKCLYRGPGGRSCAVGCLITDANYSADLEGTSMLDSSVPPTGAPLRLYSAVARSLGAEALTNDQIDLLRDLQEAHDDAKDELADDVVPEWRVRLLRIAARFGLSPAALDEVAP